jgi:mannose-1-phosphate guanylyltransferase
MQTEAESDAHRAVANWWAVILAGEDGKRLLQLTRRFPGDDPPKLLCNLRGNQTLLINQTLRRVERVVNPDRTFSIVTKVHESFYREHNGGAPPEPLVGDCQPGYIHREELGAP